MRVRLALALVSLTAPALAADDRTSMAALKAASSQVSKPKATIAYGANALDVGDLRLPPGKGPFPVVVLVHGGCWDAQIGGSADMAPLAAALVKRGFATWNIEYRRVGNRGGGWPGTFMDVAAGVDYIRALARTVPLNLSRVVVVGHSSGAHLALWATSRARLNDPVAGKNPLTPLAVVAIDGPGSLAPFVGIDADVCGRPVIVPLMGGTPAERPKEYLLASPVDHLPLKVKQLLVLGELGAMMQPYAAAAKASGDSVETLAPPDADHFNILTPGTPQGDAVVDFIAKRALPVH